MVEKVLGQLARPRCNTTSTIDTECSQIKEPLSSHEGGQEAWLTVAGSFLVYYCSYGVINSFGFFQTYYQTEFLTSTRPSTISLIGTTQIALMSFLATISGAICDAYGFRVNKLVVN
jgi:MCP family monocarboxylic acid transporter-like MFS transporter 10